MNSRRRRSGTTAEDRSRRSAGSVHPAPAAASVQYRNTARRQETGAASAGQVPVCHKLLILAASALCPSGRRPYRSSMVRSSR